MRRLYEPIELLSPLAVLNGVNFHNGAVTIKSLLSDTLGSGVLRDRDLAGHEEDDNLLLTVPQSLVLSLENVWIHAKADPDLKQVLEALGDFTRVR